MVLIHPLSNEAFAPPPRRPLSPLSVADSNSTSSPTRTRKKLPLKPRSSRQLLHPTSLQPGPPSSYDDSVVSAPSSSSSSARLTPEFVKNRERSVEPPEPTPAATANLRQAATSSRQDLLMRGVSMHAAMGSVASCSSGEDDEEDERGVDPGKVRQEEEASDSQEPSPSVYSQQDEEDEEEDEPPPPPASVVSPLKLKGRELAPVPDDKSALRDRLGLDPEPQPPDYPPLLTINRDPDAREGIEKQPSPAPTSAEPPEESEADRVAREEAEERLVADQRMEKLRAEKERNEAHASQLELAHRALEAELVKGLDTMTVDEVQFAATRFDPGPPLTSPPSTVVSGTVVERPRSRPPQTLPLDNTGKGHDRLPVDPYWNPAPPPEREETEVMYGGAAAPAYEPPPESMRGTPLPPFTTRANTRVGPPPQVHRGKEAFFTEARREDWRRENGLEEWVRNTNEAFHGGNRQQDEAAAAAASRAAAGAHRSYQPPPRLISPNEFGQRPYSTQPGYPGGQSLGRGTERPPLEFDHRSLSQGDVNQQRMTRRRQEPSREREQLSPAESSGAAGYYGGSLGVAMRVPEVGMPLEAMYEPLSPAQHFTPSQHTSYHTTPSHQPQLSHSTSTSMRRHRSELPHPSEFEHAANARQQRRFTSSPRGGASAPSPYGALPPPPVPHTGYASMAQFTSPAPFSAAPGTPVGGGESGFGFGNHLHGAGPSQGPSLAQQRWEEETRRQQLYMAQQARGSPVDPRGGTGASIGGSNSPPADSIHSSTAGETKTRKQSMKQLFGGITGLGGGGGGGKGKEREKTGEFEKTSEKTAVLWGWT